MAGNNIDVELWNLRVPLVPPIQSPKGMTTETFLLLAFLSDQDGHRGVGYSSFRKSSRPVSSLRSRLLAPTSANRPDARSAPEKFQSASG